MKHFIIAITALISSNLIAQTDVISNKSHSGTGQNINLERDNFGMPSITVDSIIYLSKNCIIEVSSYHGYDQLRDTVCDHPYFIEHGYNLDEIKKMYPSNTVFYGFKESKETIKVNHRRHTNSINWLIGVVILMSTIYMVYPKFKSN